MTNELFIESFRKHFNKFNCESLRLFGEVYCELQTFARFLLNKYGREVTDEINVIFWAKDENGTPCLVEGAYNYWIGDDEMTLSDVAEGACPKDFMDRLEKCIDNMGKYVSELAESEEDYDDLSCVRFGWEYATTNQGNLFWGRSNVKKRQSFCEVIYAYGDTDCAELESNTFNKDSLLSLVKAIKDNTVEKPRY